MLPYKNYVALMKELDDLVAAFEAHPDPHTRDAAIALLNGLDLLHREGLQRLVAVLRERDGGAILDEGVEEDRVVRALLGLYDLAELDVPEEADEGRAPDPARREDAGESGADGQPARPPATGFVPLSGLRYRKKPNREPGPGSGNGDEDPGTVPDEEGG